MKTRYVLLFIGILGVLASMWRIGFQDPDISREMIGLVCGACLIYGFFELNKMERNEKKTK